MNKKIRIGLVLALLLAILLGITHCESITRSIVAHYLEQREDSMAYPDSGTYACDSLNMAFSFGGSGIMVTCPDGSREQVHADFSGRFLFGEDWVAFYHWEQEDDILEIEFDSAPEGIPERVTFRFCPQNP